MLFPCFLLGVYIKPWLIFHCGSKALQPHLRNTAPALDRFSPFFFVIIYRDELIDASEFPFSRFQKAWFVFRRSASVTETTISGRTKPDVFDGRLEKKRGGGKQLCFLLLLLFLVKCVGDGQIGQISGRRFDTGTAPLTRCRCSCARGCWWEQGWAAAGGRVWDHWQLRCSLYNSNRLKLRRGDDKVTHIDTFFKVWWNKSNTVSVLIWIAKSDLVFWMTHHLVLVIF